MKNFESLKFTTDSLCKSKELSMKNFESLKFTTDSLEADFFLNNLSEMGKKSVVYYVTSYIIIFQN